MLFLNRLCLILPGQEAHLLVWHSVVLWFPVPVPVSEPAPGSEPAVESPAAVHSHCVQAPSLNHVTKQSEYSYTIRSELNIGTDLFKRLMRRSINSVILLSVPVIILQSSQHKLEQISSSVAFRCVTHSESKHTLSTVYILYKMKIRWQNIIIQSLDVMYD